MNVEVNIDAASINEQVAKAVIGSAIGEEIKKQIQERLKDSYSMGGAVKTVIDQVIKKAIADTLDAEPHATVMREAVKAHLSDEVLAQVIKKTWDSIRY